MRAQLQIFLNFYLLNNQKISYSFLHGSIFRSAALSLPAGRHVLKFNMSAPLGYYVNLVSTTEFTFGDEEDVMPKLKLVRPSTSYRFQEKPNLIDGKSLLDST